MIFRVLFTRGYVYWPRQLVPGTSCEPRHAPQGDGTITYPALLIVGDGRQMQRLAQHPHVHCVAKPQRDAHRHRVLVIQPVQVEPLNCSLFIV